MMPPHIQHLYVYFLSETTKSMEALKKFYAWRGSKDFVKSYASRRRKFYVRYMQLARLDDPFYKERLAYDTKVFAARQRRK